MCIVNYYIYGILWNSYYEYKSLSYIIVMVWFYYYEEIFFIDINGYRENMIIMDLCL